MSGLQWEKRNKQELLRRPPSPRKTIRQEPMTRPQRKFLAKLLKGTGRPMPRGLTKREASALIEELLSGRS